MTHRCNTSRKMIGAAFFCLSAAAMATSADRGLLDIANSQLLPENFTVGVAGHVVVNHGGIGLRPTILPTVNEVTTSPGCYLACYSLNSENSVYGLADNIYVVGQYRVEGEYGKNQQNARLCEVKGFEGMDISADANFSAACTRHFSAACPTTPAGLAVTPAAGMASSRRTFSPVLRADL